MSRFLTAGGRERFLLGVNFWPRANGPRMWQADRFDERRLRIELSQMRRAGLAVLRCFLFAPSSFSSPGVIDEGVMGRFRRFLELCGEEKIAVLPTLVVGHMSGENFPLPGQGGRSLYQDEELLVWQERLASAAARAAAGLEAPIGWLLSNEITLFAGESDPLTALGWAARITGALRASGSTLPVGTGDGVLALAGGESGFDPSALVEVVDFIGPHLYRADADPLRQAAYTVYALRSLLWLGRPVLLEEFGASASQASEEAQAQYLRETLLTGLALGAAGGLVWCWSDFADRLATEAPYADHPFELSFGVTRADGSEKAACDELREIAALCDRLDFTRLRYARPAAALVVPRQARQRVPFSADDRSALVDTVVQAVLLATRASLEVDVVPEDALARGAVDPAQYRLFLLPSTQKLAAPTWDLLAERVRAGATLYWSWFGGDRDFHQGAWCHRFEELTGCRHRLRYGCPDRTEEIELLDLFDGPTLSVQPPASGSLFMAARLPIVLGDEAEILAVDKRDEPALVRHPLGDGQVLFLTLPWERWLSVRPQGDERELSHTIYSVVADRAGLPPRYAAADSRIETHVAEEGCDDLVFCLNRSFLRIESELAIPGDAELIYPAGAESRRWDAFLGKEARVYRVRAVRP